MVSGEFDLLVIATRAFMEDTNSVRPKIALDDWENAIRCDGSDGRGVGICGVPFMLHALFHRQGKCSFSAIFGVAMEGVNSARD